MKKNITRISILLFLLLIAPRVAFTQMEWKQTCGIVQPPTTHLLKPDTTVNGDSVIIIPTVFHILTEGGAENVSKTQIFYALQFLNQDFNRQNPDTIGIPEVFQQLRGNPKVEFRLARLDPQGNCTDGIERIYTPLTGTYDNFLQLQPNFSWDHTRYLNIYVMKWIDYQNSPLYTGISYLAPVDSGQNLPAQWDALAVVYGEGNDLHGIPRNLQIIYSDMKWDITLDCSTSLVLEQVALMMITFLIPRYKIHPAMAALISLTSVVSMALMGICSTT